MSAQVKETKNHFDTHLRHPETHGEDIFALSGEQTHTETANVINSGRAIFDAGTIKSFPILAQNLLSLRSLKDTYHLFITHHHVDHIQATTRLANLIASFGGHTIIYASEGTRDAIYRGNALDWGVFLYPKSKVVAFPIDEIVHDGDTFEIGDTFVQAIETPGHTPGDMSYLVENHGKRIMVSGDAAVGGGISRLLGSDLEAYRDSQEKLKSFTFDYMFEGHGDPSILLPKDVFNKRIEKCARTWGDLKPGFRGLWNPFHS